MAALSLLHRSSGGRSSVRFVASILREIESGLLIPEQAMDEAAIQRELSRRGRGLFLDKEVYRGELLYTVKLHVPDGEPFDVMPWVSHNGRPLPLGSGLLDQLDSLRKEHHHVTPGEANEAREKAIDRDTDIEQNEIIRTVGPRIGATRSHVRKVSVPERARRNEADRQAKLKARAARRGR